MKRWLLALALLVSAPGCDHFENTDAGWWCRMDTGSSSSDNSHCSADYYCEDSAADAPIAGDRLANGAIVEYSIWCFDDQCKCEEQNKPTGSFKAERFCSNLKSKFWETLKAARTPCGFAPLN